MAQEDMYSDLTPDQRPSRYDGPVRTTGDGVWVPSPGSRLPAAQLSNQEIVREARDLHAHFEQLAQRYEQAPPAQRAEIREEMQPYVNRERELRQEYTGRISPEISQDRVPDQQIGYSR